MDSLGLRRPATLLLCSALLAMGALPAMAEWEADPGSAAWNQQHRAPMNFLEEQVPNYSLPPVLQDQSGRTIDSVEDWEAYRSTLLAQFEQNIYGVSPGLPEQLSFDVTTVDPRAMDGRATHKQLIVRSQHQGRSFSFPVDILIPNAVQGPAPTMLTININSRDAADPTRTIKSERWPAEQAIERGYAMAVFHKNDLAPDNPSDWRNGVVDLFAGDEPLASDAWGAIAAWGWGASRVMDYIEQDDTLDQSKVAVLGHSRGGKAALWAGARDDRFAMVVSNNSGCTGAALARREYGEDVAKINNDFPHWFADNYNQYNNNEQALPIDQHQLVSLIAPRAVYVGSADEDLWADPRGEFLSLAHANPAYALYGDPTIDPNSMPDVDQPLHLPGRGYHVAPGGHSLNLYAWTQYMNYASAYAGFNPAFNLSLAESFEHFAGPSGSTVDSYVSDSSNASWTGNGTYSIVMTDRDDAFDGRSFLRLNDQLGAGQIHQTLSLDRSLAIDQGAKLTFAIRWSQADQPHSSYPYPFLIIAPRVTDGVDIAELQSSSNEYKPDLSVLDQDKWYLFEHLLTLEDADSAAPTFVLSLKIIDPQTQEAVLDDPSQLRWVLAEGFDSLDSFRLFTGDRSAGVIDLDAIMLTTAPLPVPEPTFASAAVLIVGTLALTRRRQTGR